MMQIPQNTDTERELLGILMTCDTSTGVRDCWSAGLTPEDFAVPAHELIYRTIVDRLKRGEDSDDLSICNQLRREEVPVERGKTVNALEFLGGQGKVMSLADHAGVPSLVASHAAEIVAQALSRELVAVGDEVSRGGYSLAPIAETVTAAETRLARARDRADGRHGAARPSDVADLLQQVLENYLSPEPDDLLPFQLPTLNAIGGGMAPGDVVVVGARSGVGKTW